MADVLRVGIIGCGNISTTYLSLAPLFAGYRITAVADINMDSARTQAAAFDVQAMAVDDLLDAPDVDLVINLTIPAAHFDVSKAILQAGKHVYSEKPFVLTVAQAQELTNLAHAKSLRIGSAPDTFLGASHQLGRTLIDTGAIGQVTSGTAVVMSAGMEDWHPNPDFFFQKGGGPVLDLGPYYICNLVQMLGPVSQVTSMTGMAQMTRKIGTGPRAGEAVAVETPTTIHAVMKFESGAIITLLSSWDVLSNTHPIIELYGTDGTMTLPDPNFFGGEVTVASGRDAPEVMAWDHPFDVSDPTSSQANYRGAGLADMAQAIASKRPHRCNETFATHVIDVMTAILEAGETGEVVTLSTRCDRPAPLGPDDALALMAG